jgi:hypothetical protein
VERLQASLVIKATWVNVMRRELGNSATDAALLRTIRDWQTFVFMLNLDAHDGDMASAIADGIRYTGSNSLYRGFSIDGPLLLGDQISAALDGNTTLCRQTHDLKALANITFWAGLGVLYAPTARNWNGATGDCATIVVATFNPPTNLRAGGSDSLQLVFKLEFSDGTRVPGDFEVTLVGGGFTFASSGSEHLTAGSPAGPPLTVGTVAEQGPPYVLTAAACWFLDGLARNLCSPQFTLPFGSPTTTPTPAPTTPAATQSALGPVILVEGLAFAPVVGVCESVLIAFGIGHTGPTGPWVAEATGATFSITGDGALELIPGSAADSPRRTFRAGTVAGSATIKANGYFIDPQHTIAATLSITVDPLAGVYRDPSTKTQLVVQSGLGHALPAGTYWLVVSGLAEPLDVVPSGSLFHDSSNGHTIDFTISPASATGTIDGQSVTLPRVCGL